MPVQYSLFDYSGFDIEVVTVFIDTPDGQALPERIVRAGDEARKAGALQPLSTYSGLIRERGVDFVVHVLEGLPRKIEETGRQRQEERNPFLPYERALYVADIGPDHVCILNKFPVVDRHVLIITREYEPQENLLTRRDFLALVNAMRETRGLGFYNSGPGAGASQPHKHLQIVPVPMHSRVSGIPVETLVRQADGGEYSPALPFRHRLSSGLEGAGESPEAAAARLHEDYLEGLAIFGMEESGASPVYNLLLTGDWMMLVPRTRSHFEGIPVNALGFAGGLLVKNDDQLRRLERVGPLHALAAVAG